MIPDTGRRFGPYEILGRLGGGGMGHVYKAWDARLHREVAVKFLHNEYSMPGMRERFLREARAASALNNPHICSIFDIGEQDGDPYLVMELLEGETLKDRIDKRSIQVEEMLCVGKEVSEALGAAHAKGIIHRDVKPANIFLVAKPHSGFQSKVLDFGLAKIEGGVLVRAAIPGDRHHDGGFDRGNSGVHVAGAGAGRGAGFAFGPVFTGRGAVRDGYAADSVSGSDERTGVREAIEPAAGTGAGLERSDSEGSRQDHHEADVEGADAALPDGRMSCTRRCRGWGKSRPAGGCARRSARASIRRLRWLARRNRWCGSGDRRSGGLPILTCRRCAPAEEKPTSRPSHDPPHFLRPVARVPSHASPRPSSEVPSPPSRNLSARSEAPSGSPMIAPRVAEPAPAPVAQPVAAPVVAAAVLIQPARLSVQQVTEAQPVASAAAVAVAAPAVAAAEAPSAAGAVAPEAREVSSGEFRATLAEPAAAPRRRRIRPVWVVGSLVLLVVAAIAAVLIVNRGRFGPTMLTERDPVVLTEIDNLTGNKALDGAVAEGLQIALAQSPYLLLRSGDDYRIMRRQVLASLPDAPDTATEQAARTAAQRLGTRAYLYGSVKGSTPPYLLHVSLLNTATNEVMSSAEERAPSQQEVPAAIDRLADDLRAAVGEDSDSISRSHNALSREATSNLDALRTFALGEDALAGGRTLDALRLYEQAVAAEPRFTLAYLRLTVLYRKQRAEVAAAEAAKLALAAADNTSERTRTVAQYEYEMNSSGDYNRAAGLIRKLVTDNPNDADALEKLARVLRLQGRMAESLQMAQQAYALDPLNADAYTQADNALIGLDRYDASYQLQGQEQRLGLARAGGMLTSAYLEGRQDSVDSAAATFEGRKESYKPDWSYGLYLDNIGHLAAATQLWKKNAAAALQTRQLASAAAFLLSQGALDHALIGDCAGGLALAHDSATNPQGMAAIFNSGMASALCGDTAAAQAAVAALQKSYPQSFNVNSFYVANIRAAVSLHGNDPAAALEVLKPARQFDLISLTPFLRGRAHVALRQGQIGIVDYQTVLAHRGVTFIVGSDVYPVAQIGVARAFSDTGDLNNSSDAYRKFLELWKTADPNQPLVAEARAHTK